MSDSVHGELINIISSFKQMPYLFIGSGFSSRYSYSPVWDQLLQRVWSTLNPDGTEIDYVFFKKSIENDIQLNRKGISEHEISYYVNPAIAQEISDEFNKKFLTDKTFRSSLFSVDQLNHISKYIKSPFKYYVANMLCEVSPSPEKEFFHELDILRSNHNKIAGIITTNYDCILENHIFTDFDKKIGQDNLLISNAINVFEIYKIHGCCSDPDSIILTSDDYEYFDSRLKYLSAKLLTVFVESPIIFIGYSISDINIRRILKEISICLTTDQMNAISDKFIFISRSHDGNDHIQDIYIDFGEGRIKMTEFKLNDFSILYESFSSIQNSLPVKMVRKLQDMVREYVYSAEAQNKIVFGSIDSPDIDDSAAAIYFGNENTISQIGFKHYSIDDILEDILFNNNPTLMNKQLIEKTFPSIRSSAGSTLLPIYKYIKGLNYPLSEIPPNLNIIRSYDDDHIQPNSSERRTLNDSIVFDSISEIIKKFPNHIQKQTAYIKKYARSIEADELKSYCISLWERAMSDLSFKNKYISYIRKLIAILDYKLYSDQ